MLTKDEWENALNRIDYLMDKLEAVETSKDDPEVMELNNLTDLVVEYENLHFPIAGEPV